MDICIPLGFGSTKRRASCDQFGESHRQMTELPGTQCSRQPLLGPAPAALQTGRGAQPGCVRHYGPLTRPYASAPEQESLCNQSPTPGTTVNCTYDFTVLPSCFWSHPRDRSRLKGGFVWFFGWCFFFFFFLPWNIWVNHICRYFKFFVHVTPELYLLLK